MSIAEKTLLLKQDFDEVHAKGYEDGKNDEYNAFWDSIYDCIEKSKSTFYIFSGTAWNDTTFKPPRDIVLKADARSAFRCIAVTDLAKVIDERGLKIDFTNVKYITEIFAEVGCERIGVLDYSVATATAITGEFPLRCPNLVTIDKIKWGNNFNISGRHFINCPKLQNVVFEGVFKNSISFEQAPSFSDTTIQNIIDCLADLTGGTAQTLTLHATVGAKLTDEQKATITAKNWTLVY